MRLVVLTFLCTLATPALAELGSAGFDQGAVPLSVFTPITGNPAYKLVFDDEFQGGSLNTSTKWNAPVNQTDNTYSSYSPALTVNETTGNVTVHDGCLDLASTFVSSTSYTTSALVSQPTVTSPGIYWEARVKMPSTFNGQSFGAAWANTSGFSFPEVDTLEFWAPNGKTSNGWNDNITGFGTYAGTTVANPSNWHVFGAWWTSTAVTFYVDGAQTRQATNNTNQTKTMWASLVNNSICSSGICGGQPSTSTGFPDHFFINYVHTYALIGTAVTPDPTYGGPGDNSGAHTTCAGN